MIFLKDYNLFENNELKNNIINEIQEIIKDINRKTITIMSLLKNDFTDADIADLIIVEEDDYYSIIDSISINDITIDEYHKDVKEDGTVHNTHDNFFKQEYENLEIKHLKAILELLKTQKLNNKLNDYDI